MSPVGAINHCLFLHESLSHDLEYHQNALIDLQFSNPAIIIHNSAINHTT